MSEPRRKDTWLVAGIVVVLAIALGFISWSALSIRQRQIELSDRSLQRLQQLIAVRLDAAFDAIGSDLREEAVFIDGMDRLDTAAVIARWRSLMRAHRTITAVKLADEMGGELSLVQDTAGVVQSALPWKAGAIRTAAGVYDPRQRVWYSKALEDQRGEVTWTLRPGTEGKHPRMQCSQLLRPRKAGTAFQILMFEVDLRRSTWPEASSPVPSNGAVLMDGKGGLLIDGAPGGNGALQQAATAAIAAWLNHRAAIPFTVEANGRSFRALVSSYGLNGETLYTGVLIDTSLIGKWTASERRELAVMGALLILLTLLLLRSWMVRRRETLRMEREARRSLTQEQQLVKALGEREVLNREVHHRVKNNLQVVSSLLNLQAARSTDSAVREEFLRGKRRIDIIALVHHRLYALKDLRNVQLKGFFDSLILSIAELHEPRSRSVSHEVSTNELSVDQDTAIELGIILCELMANCYEHAFPYPTGGHIDVVVQNVEGDLHRLVVKDNGKGLPDGPAAGPGKLGLEIVAALAEQLDGSFHIRTNGGVTFEVLFRQRR